MYAFKPEDITGFDHNKDSTHLLNGIVKLVVKLMIQRHPSLAAANQFVPKAIGKINKKDANIFLSTHLKPMSQTRYCRKRQTWISFINNYQHVSSLYEQYWSKDEDWINFRSNQKVIIFSMVQMIRIMGV